VISLKKLCTKILRTEYALGILSLDFFYLTLELYYCIYIFRALRADLLYPGPSLVDCNVLFTVRHSIIIRWITQASIQVVDFISRCFFNFLLSFLVFSLSHSVDASLSFILLSRLHFWSINLLNSSSLFPPTPSLIFNNFWLPFDLS
jgi:hypothetical protein